jgi:putative membrane protein
MSLLLRWLVSASAIILSAYIITGVTITNFWSALWVSLFLGFVNVTLRPLLIVLTFPVNILTLGLFVFVINAGLILLASSIVKGFEVQGFWVAMLFSLLLSIVSYVLHKAFGTK